MEEESEESCPNPRVKVCFFRNPTGPPSTTIIIINASHLRPILARWLDQINFSVRAVSRRSGRRRSQSSYYYHTNPAPLQPGSFAVSTRCPAIALSYTAVVAVGKINWSFEDICAGMVPESHRGASTEIRSTQKVMTECGDGLIIWF